MGTNVQLNCPPVCINRSLQAAGIAFKLSAAAAAAADEDCMALRLSSTDKLMLSDSGIQIDLCHEDGAGDTSELNSCRTIVGSKQQKRNYRSSSTTNETKKDLTSGVCQEAAGSPSSNPPDCSNVQFKNQTTTIHRAKGRPAKLTNGGVGGGSAIRGIIQCPICDKRFNNSSALAKHKLIHSDERKYSCSQCSKAFKRQDHLNGHLMTHSSKKPYECKFPNCDKSYCDQRSLRRHIENHHQYTDCWGSNGSADKSLVAGNTPLSSNDSQAMFSFDQPFLSQFSDPGLASGTNLQASPGPLSPMPTSSPKVIWPLGYNPLDEPKPVKCTVCDRGFKNMPALNGHMRLHGGFPGCLRKDSTEIGTKSEDMSVENGMNDAASSSVEIASRREKACKPGRKRWPSSALEMVTLPDDSSFKQEVVSEDRDADISFTFEIDSRNSGCLDFSESLILGAGGGGGGRSDRGTRFLDSPLSASHVADDAKKDDGREFQPIYGNDDIMMDLITRHMDAKKTDFSRGMLSSNQRTIDQRIDFDDRNKILNFDVQSSSYSPLSTRNDCWNSEKLMETSSSIVNTSSSERSVVSISRYKLPGSSGSVMMIQSNQSINNSPVVDSPGRSVHVGNNNGCLANTLGKSGGAGRPLTPGYVVPHGASYATPSLRRSSSSTIPATPCTPHSAFVVAAAHHNQPQTPTNSNFFQFPPLTNNNSSLESGHTSTPANHGYSLMQHQRQHTPRTPLSPYTPQSSTPYTPKTPSRHHRFQFPPTSTNGGCESPYPNHRQKSAAAYHPYHQSSSHLSIHQFHHQQQQLQQNASQENFQCQVMQVEEEMAKHLNLVMPEDNSQQDQILFGRPDELNTSAGQQQQQLLHQQQQQLQQQQLQQQQQQCQMHDLDQCIAGNVLRCGDLSLDEIEASLGRKSISEQLTIKEEENFFDERMDHTSTSTMTTDFDMDLDLNLLNPTIMMDRKQQETENDSVICGLTNDLGGLENNDVLDFFLANDHFGNGVELQNVDVLSRDHDVISDAGVVVYSDMHRMNSCIVSASNGMASMKAVDQSDQSKWNGHQDLSGFDETNLAKRDLIYLNPNQLECLKKKKRRPEPIVIPPCVNNYRTTMTNGGNIGGGGGHIHHHHHHLYSPQMAPTDGCRNPPPYAPKSSIDRSMHDSRVSSSFRLMIDSRAPQSAPPFRYHLEQTQMGDQRDQDFILDQSILDNFTDVGGVHSFQDASNYVSVVNNTSEKDNMTIAGLLEIHAGNNDDDDDVVGHFDANSMNGLIHHQSNRMNDVGCQGRQEFGNWKMDEINTYQQTLLEMEKNSLR